QGLVQAPPPRRRLSASSAETEHVPDRREAEVAKHAAELRFGAAEPDVVGAEAAAAGGPHARLLGIDLPRMDEDDRGLPLAVDASHAPAHVPVREHAQPTAAAEGQVAAGEPCGGDRELPEPSAVPAMDDVGEALRRGRAV